MVCHLQLHAARPGEAEPANGHVKLPTYDIDAAWSYKNKGIFRTVGGFARDFLAHNKDDVRYRARVIMGAEAADIINTLLSRSQSLAQNKGKGGGK